MKTIEAGDYKTRDSLESYVKSVYGLTTQIKSDVVKISGTREELERLQLTDETTFWGIPCVITDTPTEQKPAVSEIDRGIGTEFGINGRKQKFDKLP